MTNDTQTPRSKPMKKYLYGHDSFETGYEVSDYPWGYRMRTEVRYWIETNETHGQRFCKCTKDPRTGKWCAPKKDTYKLLIFMFLDSEEHVQSTGVTFYTELSYLEKVQEEQEGKLSEYQEKKLNWLIARAKVMEHVTFSFTANPTEEEREKIRESNEKESRKIAGAIAYVEGGGVINE